MKRWRKRAGLTQQEAAVALGLSGFNTIARYEAGRRGISEPVFRQAMSLYQRLAQERHGDVPRTTSVDALERPPKTLEEAQLRVLSLLYDLEARLVDAGASAKVRAKWKRYLDYDYHIRMFAGGYKELPVSDVVGRYNNLVSLARALTQTTIDRLAFPEEDDDE